MAHDGSEGLSPDGWLPDRISVGVLTRVFTPELVDAAVEDAGAREQRRRLLPARLMVYFVLALWLFRGRNCGYGQVMVKLADGLYHQRRAAGLLAGDLDPDGWVDAGQGRRWRPPNISSLSRGRGKLGPAPVRFLFEQVAGPIGDEQAPGVSCCGLRVVSIDGSTSDVPDSAANDEHFGRPSNQARDGAFPQVRWLAAAESGTGSLLGASLGPYRDSEQALARDLLEQGCFGPGMLVLADRKFLSWALAREFLATGAHILWRASAAFTLKPVKVLADGTYLAELTPPRKSDGPPLTVRVIEYTVHTAPGTAAGTRRPPSCSAWSPTCSTRRSTRRWTWRAATRGGGDARPSSATTRRTWARASRCCAARTRPASSRKCGRCSPSTRRSARSSGSGRPPRASPRTRSASRMPWPPRRTPSRLFPPEQADLALATFLLKILAPGTFTRDRPDRASPRKTKKSGDFPARKPGEPSVTNVIRKIEFHLLSPHMIT